jgi:hypothetical protein
MQTGSRFQWVARGGYTARAVVFFLVGGLALVSGISSGESDTKSAMDTLTRQPFGRIWLGMIAVGLVGFVVWRLAQSIGNADHHDHDARGIATRLALFGSALAYVGLTYYAADHALGLGSQNGGSGERDLAAWLMSQPFGRYVAGAVGFGFIAGGVTTIAKGVLRKYEQYLAVEALGSRSIVIACVYGLTARGIIFMIVGGFFIYAAFTVSPEQAASAGDALNWLRGLPFGAVLHFLVAVGLASFGFYNLIQARYRIVKKPTVRAEKQDPAQMSSRTAGSAR